MQVVKARFDSFLSARAPFADLPLHDPHAHRDACGVGFIAARDGKSTHRLLRLAVDCLKRLDHRGARAADGTGDGAGGAERG